MSVTVAIPALGALALLLARVARLTRRLERVARAEHELRGPATALALAAAGWARGADTAAYAEVVEAQLARLRLGLDELGAARGVPATPRRAEAVDLIGLLRASAAPFGASGPPAGAQPVIVLADRPRLAGVVGNLVANAAEHGSGPLEVSATPVGGGVRLELANARRGAPRGLGLRIASGAARELGGRLDVRADGERVVARLDLPDAPA